MDHVVSLDNQPEGRTQLLTLQVVARIPAARDVVTLVLAHPGTRRAPAPYLPGQFITLSFPTTASTLYRSYSLCGDGRADVPWEITIKRHHEGVVSTFLYGHVRPGMMLRSSPPQGSFILPAAIPPGAPLVFIAGGSGITPIYGMVRALARLAPAQRPRAFLHYAYHSPDDGIYVRELAAVALHRHHRQSAPYGAGDWRVGSTGSDGRVVRLWTCRTHAQPGDCCAPSRSPRIAPSC